MARWQQRCYTAAGCGSRVPRDLGYPCGMSDHVFRHLHRVTYAECTLGNHIYYGRYLDLLEAARGEFFRSLGVTLLHLQQQDTLFPVIECQVRYKSPARYDDVLEIELWLTELTGARMAFEYRVLNQTGHLILEGNTLHACATAAERPKRLTSELKEMLKPYLRGRA
jgi:acyl-CoA thioester hydrolase